MTGPSLTRRRGLRLAGATALAAALAAPAALAQEDYPSQTITFVCAFPAGSGADVLVRYFANAVDEITDVSVIVENKAGAAGNISAEYVARADPNGYTVYVHAGTGIAMNHHLWREPPIDPRRDLRGVAAINVQAFYVIVAADSPHQTIEELNAFLREQGNDARYAVTNTPGRVLAAEYTNQLGVEPVEISYGTSADAVPDIVSGAVDFAVTDPVFTMVNEREGRTRTLATAAGERLNVTPDVPTLAESGLSIDQLGWFGAWVPAGTPDDPVRVLNDLFRQVLETEETAEFLNSMGGDVWIATPEEVDQALVDEVAEMERLVELANLPKN